MDELRLTVQMAMLSTNETNQNSNDDNNNDNENYESERENYKLEFVCMLGISEMHLFNNFKSVCLLNTYCMLGAFFLFMNKTGKMRYYRLVDEVGSKQINKQIHR